jgi:hypothetical protein
MIADVDDNQKMNLSGVIARTKITSKFDRFENGIGIELTEIPQAYKRTTVRSLAKTIQHFNLQITIPFSS